MKKALAFFWLILIPVDTARAGFSVALEAGPIWQTRNDVRVPPASGTAFSISDAASGPFLRGRVYVGYEFAERHEFRLLFAPLTITAQTTFDQVVNFAGTAFAAGTATEASYKFNSYRLTYRYKFYQGEDWQFKIGFTAKIRDADITLTQGATTASSKNVGFVPLLNFAFRYQMADAWYLLFDLDGLAAPQGRAFDGTLQAGWQMSPDFDLNFGYRTVEGGAENSTVSTFAWVHYAVLGITGRF